MDLCPVCETELAKTERRGNRALFECPRCGPYSLPGTAEVMLPMAIEGVEFGRAILSYALHRMTKREQWATVSSDVLENILRNTSLPSPMEQLDNLVLWYGQNQKSPAREISPVGQTISAVGASDSTDLGFIIQYAIDRKLLSGQIHRALAGNYIFSPMRLTLDGWQRFYELQHLAPKTYRAFMAMKFGDRQADMIFRDHFKPAVAFTGFELRRLDEEPRAGLIDDRLRVEIRQSRFLIADLTHNNNGAYWESGFAEGLGKPVIYTCRKDVFEDKSKGTHFDTNHHLTVVWELEKLEEAVQLLKAVIRSTLPGDAQLSD